MLVILKESNLSESLKEAIRRMIEGSDFQKFLASIPEVSDEEQQEIEESHGEPEGYEPVYSRQVDPSVIEDR